MQTETKFGNNSTPVGTSVSCLWSEFVLDESAGACVGPSVRDAAGEFVGEIIGILDIAGELVGELVEYLDYNTGIPRLHGALDEVLEEIGGWIWRTICCISKYINWSYGV